MLSQFLCEALVFRGDGDGAGTEKRPLLSSSKVVDLSSTVNSGKYQFTLFLFCCF